MLRVSSRLSSSSAALCTTAVRGSSAGTEASRAASADRSPASQAARVTLQPFALSSAARDSAPGASAPRRPTSSRCSAPLSANQWAVWAPSAPVPPVMSTVPRGERQSWEAGVRVGRGAGTSRRPCTPVARIASWFSSSPRAARTARRRRDARRSRSSGRSSRPPQLCGRSALITPPSPQSRAWAGAVT